MNSGESQCACLRVELKKYVLVNLNLTVCVRGNNNTIKPQSDQDTCTLFARFTTISLTHRGKGS